MRELERQPLREVLGVRGDEAIVGVPVTTAVDILMMLNTALDDPALADGTRDCIVMARDTIATLVEGSRD